MNNKHHAIVRDSFYFDDFGSFLGRGARSRHNHKYLFVSTKNVLRTYLYLSRRHMLQLSLMLGIITIYRMETIMRMIIRIGKNHAIFMLQPSITEEFNKIATGPRDVMYARLSPREDRTRLAAGGLDFGYVEDRVYQCLRT